MRPGRGGRWKERGENSRAEGQDGRVSKPLFTVMNDNFPRPLTWDTPWTLCCHANVELDSERIEGLLRSYLSKGAQDFIAIKIWRRTLMGAKSPSGPQKGALSTKICPC